VVPCIVTQLVVLPAVRPCLWGPLAGSGWRRPRPADDEETIARWAVQDATSWWSIVVNQLPTPRRRGGATQETVGGPGRHDIGQFVNGRITVGSVGSRQGRGLLACPITG